MEMLGLPASGDKGVLAFADESSHRVQPRGFHLYMTYALMTSDLMSSGAEKVLKLLLGWWAFAEIWLFTAIQALEG